MSYSQMQTMAGSPAHSKEQPVQARLQSLVQILNWSYAALWSFNPQTRNLIWRGGHWRHSDTQGWNQQYFNSTFKSCQFRPGCGSVGMAYAKGGNIWMPGSSVVDKARSKEQAEFLHRARISTAIFIAWSDGVLELGTCDNLPEDPGQMERIRTYFMTNIVPTLGQQASSHSQLSATNMQAGVVVPQAPPSFPQSSRPMMQLGSYASLSPLRHHLSDNLNTQSFEPNSLNQQIRRSASMSNLNPDMFLEDAEGKEVGMNTDNMLLPTVDAAASTWGLPTLTTRAGAMQTQQTPMSAAANQVNYPPVQQRTRGQYRSRSGTTSSSLSSLEEAASTRVSGDSSEQFFMASSQRQPSHSNTSSSPRRGTSSHSPEMNQLEDTIGTQSLQETHENRVEDDIQLDPFSLMLEGEPLETDTYSFPSLETGSMSQMDSATNGNNNHNHNNGNNSYNGTHLLRSYELPQPGQTLPSPVQTQGPFKTWRKTRILAPVLQRKNDRQNQDLLRRCIDIMKQIPQTNNNLQGFQSNEGQAVMHNVSQHGPRVASSSSPETVTDGLALHPFNQVPPRLQKRPRGGSRIATMGAVHQGHDEAAMNHMMAERRRRVKQKENFAALRRLVPIISKADKASILGDAIAYLKDLQREIEELEAGKAESERKYETLQKSYQELEQRNKELESMVHPTRLHSM